MKILIELPTWLGDAIMTTPAIENLIEQFNDAEIILIGSIISIEALKNHPKVIKTYVLDKKIISLFELPKKFKEFDLFISFRSSFRSKVFKFLISAKKKFQFNKKKFGHGHQVEKYNNFINKALQISSKANKLVLHSVESIKNSENKLLGINPGASYGSAKRWYPDEFAEVAFQLSSHYDIIIFGGPNEKNIADDIEGYLIKKGVENYQNLSDKTNVKELIKLISSLSIFITGDSGPMHIAAALQIPTVSIFGPTNNQETNQWMNQNSEVVKKNLDCQPCMKRTCPLKHHKCMKLIKPEDVLSAVRKLS
jgi:heptosyltransferase II